MKAQIEQLEKENKKLKEDNRFLTKISKEYMEKENIVEVAEFTELYKDDLEKENKKLKERVKFLEEENSNLKNNIMEDMKVQTELEEKIRFLEECLDNKEKVNKSLREDLKIWKLTAKDYAKLCWVELDDK